MPSDSAPPQPPPPADPVDLAGQPDRAAHLCVAAHDRLARTVAGVTDEVVRRPSRLPGWSVGHVLTHLARNADGHARRLAGALRGEDVARYPGGRRQRTDDIALGAGRPAAEMLADLAASCAGLEAVMAECGGARWPHSDLRGDDAYGVTACPAHRLREVEMHHVDLGLGYEPADWPDEYVAWDLPVLLATVPERLAAPGGRRALMAWLAGRGLLPADIRLDPW